ncbi:ribulose-phosphate 3-epimerase [Bdellovibrio bacteriovorus]|uniref:Ribulose-phosphate 3-epimerase n=1 Tax=Bdellovibrio bacteriovorus TaxID=959 RepID=A0A1Z3N6J6_BDEBC|nr:ribulose-phosphate 3-epimerase [Bdellovibrio bacteriovorus]
MVAPSILSADFANLEKEIKAVAQAGADWIHVDVMDGRFVPNITIGIPVVKALKKVSPLPLDVHLMIEEPERYVEEFVKAGSDYLTIHVESTKDAAGTLKRIRELGAKPGITLRPRTAVEEVLPLLPLCDLVLVMTVEPGFGGQSFMNDQVAKITRLRQEISSGSLSCLIEVDGGINAETAKICHEADVFVAGSYVFGKEYGSAIASLKGS